VFRDLLLRKRDPRLDVGPQEDPMDAKHHVVQILGVVTLLAAVIYSFYALVAFIGEDFADTWLLATHLLNVTVGGYLFWAGIRMVRWARGLPSLQTGRIKWGRVLLGGLLAFYGMKTQLHPPASAADLDQPLNKVQGQANIAIYIAVTILGVVLTISGIVAGFKSSPRPEELPRRRSNVPWP
jgi:hypothetical protein